MFSTRYTLLRVVLGAGFLFTASTLPRGATQDTNFLDNATKKWREGPVRYFLTKEEDELYKRMKTKEDRRAFIYRFWLLRDPTPGSPANEFKGNFRRRVMDANRLFTETTKPGWKTDMGKIYILIGPPDEQHRDTMARNHRGTVIWTYRSLPGTTIGPNVVVAFAKDTSGEFVLSTSPTVDAEVAGLTRLLGFDRNLGMSRADMMKQFGRDPLLMAAGAPMGMSELEIQGQLAEIQHLPPPDAILNELVTTEAYFDAIPFKTEVNYFQARDGSTYTTITLGVPSASVFYTTIRGKDRPDVRVFARLLDPDDGTVVQNLAADGIFKPSFDNDSVSIDGTLIFQAAVNVVPGRYTLLVGLEDRASSRVGTSRKLIVIPDLTGTHLRLSSITLADRIDPLQVLPAPGTPYILGNFLVVPKSSPEFRKTEPFQIYYQVYGVKMDESTGKQDLEIIYSFHRLEKGEYQFYGRQTILHSSSAAQGFSIPIDQWPEGEYRLDVSVTDHGSSETTVEQVKFKIL